VDSIRRWPLREPEADPAGTVATDALDPDPELDSSLDVEAVGENASGTNAPKELTPTARLADDRSRRVDCGVAGRGPTVPAPAYWFNRDGVP
jgi:hypothetical protein